MQTSPLSTDEAVLAALRDHGLATSAGIASLLGLHERTARRRLRRLIKDGYAFSPEHGVYRITAAGMAVMTPLPDRPTAEEPERRSDLLTATPRDLLERWRQR